MHQNPGAKVYHRFHTECYVARAEPCEGASCLVMSRNMGLCIAKHKRELRFLRSYVGLAGEVVWNEALVGSGLYITFPSIPPGPVTFRDRKLLLSESAE